MRKLAFVLCVILVAVIGLVASSTRPVYADGLTDMPPTVIAPTTGQLLVYERSSVSNVHVFQKSYNNGWSGWTQVTGYGDTPGPTLSSNMVPVPAAPAAFTQLNDNGMWCGSIGLPWNRMTGAQAVNWAATAQASTPGVMRPGTVARLIGIEWTGKIYTGTWTPDFTPTGCSDNTFWTNTGGTSTYTGAIAGTNIDTDALMAVTGTDGRVYWNYNQAGWNPTASGRGTSGTALTTWGGGHYDLFVRGTDGAMWHTNDPNGIWDSLGGQLNSGPACASWGFDRIDCFAIGTSVGNPVYHTWFVGGTGWFPWENLGTA